MVPNGLNWSKMVPIVWNCQKWSDMFLNGLKWFMMVSNSSKRSPMFTKRSTCSKFSQIVLMSIVVCSASLLTLYLFVTVLLNHRISLPHYLNYSFVSVKLDLNHTIWLWLAFFRSTASSWFSAVVVAPCWIAHITRLKNTQESALID